MLDIAATWAGFKTVGFCEWEEYPRKILTQRFPGVPIWGDIRTLTGGDFYESTGLRTVDLISGGFPCQPFSAAGQRRGTADNRFLWPEMLRVIKELKPTFVLGENVDGLVSMAEPVGELVVESRSLNSRPDDDYYHAVSSQQERMLLHGIAQDIENAGYEVQIFVVPACGVDAPHRRYRIAIVGHAKHTVMADATLA